MMDYKGQAEAWYENTFKQMTPEQKKSARRRLLGYGPTPHMINNAIRCLKAGRRLPC